MQTSGAFRLSFLHVQHSPPESGRKAPNLHVASSTRRLGGGIGPVLVHPGSAGVRRESGSFPASVSFHPV